MDQSYQGWAVMFVIRPCVIIIAAAVISLTGISGNHAQEKSVKTQKGLNFAVPDDWPIEEYGGALAPIPVEEYVSRKFKAIEARLDAIEKSLSEKEEPAQSASVAVTSSSNKSPEMELLLETLTQDTQQLKVQVEALKSSAPIPVSTSAEQTVSDKNIADQLRLLKSRLEDIERRLGTIEFHQDI